LSGATLWGERTGLPVQVLAPPLVPFPGSSLELDRLDPQIVRQRRLVLPDLADHRLGCLTLEKELDDLLGLGADDAVEAWKGKGGAWRSFDMFRLGARVARRIPEMEG
jgi:hypothetical protein